MKRRYSSSRDSGHSSDGDAKDLKLPLPSLNLTQVELVHSVFKSKEKSTTVLASINSVQVTVADIKHLDKSNWLNDELINLTSQIFMQSMRSMTPPKKIFIWTSFFVNRLIDNETGDYCYQV